MNSTPVFTMNNTLVFTMNSTLVFTMNSTPIFIMNSILILPKGTGFHIILTFFKVLRDQHVLRHHVKATGFNILQSLECIFHTNHRGDAILEE